MTCIVGLVDKKNNSVIIGGDSAGVSDLNITVRTDKKVFYNGDFLIGGAISFRMIQLLRFSLKPPPVNTSDIYRYMCTDFISEVQRCFEQGSFLQDEDGGGRFLVGYKNRLFCIQEDFQVAENSNGMDAIGCGGSFALGALHSLMKFDYPSKDKVRKALEAADVFSAGVCKPFKILETKK